MSLLNANLDESFVLYLVLVNVYGNEVTLDVLQDVMISVSVHMTNCKFKVIK